jgi:hypothetical protein
MGQGISLPLLPLVQTQFTVFPEICISRTVTLHTVIGQKLYFIPLGEHFLSKIGETSVLYNGVSHVYGDGFYTHVHRSMSPFMNITDTCIGIKLTTAPSTIVTLVLNWKQRILQVAPPPIIPVKCDLIAGVWKIDYVSDSWRCNSPTLCLNAVQVAEPPPGCVVEFWRICRRRGGSHGGNRSGRRYVPIFRGPAVHTENSALFHRSQFDPISDCAPWRKFKVCYYNITTGARSQLSQEVIVVGGSKRDQHNKPSGDGAYRYGLWINR